MKGDILSSIPLYFVMGALIDGAAISKHILHRVKEYVLSCTKMMPRRPCLSIVQVGDNVASQIYVNTKVGIDANVTHLPSTTQQMELQAVVASLSKRGDVDGIIVQLPLPVHLHVPPVIEEIDPLKDVDGLHPYNTGRLCQAAPMFRPCTAVGIMKLLESLPVDLTGKNATVIGRSNLVGRPIALQLLHSSLTVTVCHRRTIDLRSHVIGADVLIVAAGCPRLIPGAWVKEGSIVIDVGINRTPDGKLVGDVIFDEARKRAAYITPVPGGVGPMTVAMLLQNVVEAYDKNMLNHQKSHPK